MAEKFYREFVRWGTICGLGLLLISLSQSKVGMSISQFMLAGAFILERVDLRKGSAYFRRKNDLLFYLTFIPFYLYLLFDSIFKGIKLFSRNRPALIFSSIMLMHLLGLLFSTDFDYALKDLRTKLPLLLLPLYISTSQAFGRKAFYWLILLFCASLFVRTMINSWYFFHENFVDIRDVSKSISHLIVALLISFAIFSLALLISRKRDFSPWMKILFVLLIIWFIIYLVMMQSATGLSITAITLMIFMVVKGFSRGARRLKITIGLLLGALVVGTVLYINSMARDYYKVHAVNLSKLEEFSSRGNKYIHNTKDLTTENGNYIWIYIQWDELKESWAKKSRMSLDSSDKKNQLLLNTLVRFLTSKGEKKDGDAVDRLSLKEVKAIENGVANVVFIRDFSIRGRIYEFLAGYDEYKKTGNPSGSTIMQRLEYWKASVGIIREHWLTGVGTGDMNEAFQEQYVKMNSKLPVEQRWRAHNQFLSIFVGFGIFGILWFLFSIFYPPYSIGKYHDYFFFIFFVISILSMIPEETLESQAGVTFFACFYSFLLWGRKEEDPL